MSLTFYLLGSGSSGNVGLVSAPWEGGDYHVLVDAGLPWRVCSKGAPFARPRALLLTHEHSDHIRFAAQYASSFKIPVYATEGTLRSPALRHIEGRPLKPGKVVHVGPLEVLPFATPHDAEEPIGLVFRSRQSTLGWVTDLGEITPSVEEALLPCDALVLEFNHDPELLRRGPYPWPLKRRISGGKGHLSNEQAAPLLGKLAHTGRLKTAVLAHLSQTNNSPALARRAALSALGEKKISLAVAEPRRPVGPFHALGPATQLSLF